MFGVELGLEREAGDEDAHDHGQADEERAAGHGSTLRPVDEKKLLSDAAKRGYTVEKDRAVWRVRDEARSWQPAMRDRDALLRLLALRLKHADADPNAIG